MQETIQRKIKASDILHGLYGALLYIEIHINKLIFLTLLILFLVYEILQHLEGKNGLSEDILELAIGFTIANIIHFLIIIFNVLIHN